MKESKLKERFNNAFEAFFEGTETSNQIETVETVAVDSKTRTASNESLLKHVFRALFSATLYIPSALILGTFGFLFTLTEIFGVPSMMPLSSNITMDVLIRIFLVLGGASLFSILGVGNIKEIKHFSIPASIGFTGVALGFLFGLLTMFDPALRQYFLFPPNENSIFYLLPVFLVVGVLAKNWIDNSPDEKTS
jgi:hypothetical protein